MANNRTFFKNVQTGRMTLKDIFSDVKRKHTPQETARVFIAGTDLTTPAEAEMLSGWQKPFLFARFFLAIVIFLAAMLPMLLLFNDHRVCYLLTIGISVINSFTLLLLFWEMNIPRNISLYEAAKLVGIGGAISLFATFALGKLVPTSNAIWAPLTEEPAKLLVVYLVLRKKNYKFILNGILVGACVGTGFSFIENLYYSWENLLGTLIQTGDAVSAMVNGVVIALVRAIYDLSGHGIWAALYGGALVMVKGANPVTPKHLTDLRFLKYFAISFGLHMFRNSGFTLGISILGIFSDSWMALVAITVVAVLPMLRKGVNEIVDYTAALNQGRVTLAVEREAPIVRDIGGGSGNPAGIAPVQSGSSPAETLPLDENPWGMPPVSVSARIATLQCVAGPYLNTVVQVKEGSSLVIGRTVGSDLPLERCSNVSSRHCTVTVSGGQILVTDMNSTNGTFLDGHRLQPGVATVVASGATLYLGSRDCAFRITLN